MPRTTIYRTKCVECGNRTDKSAGVALHRFPFIGDERPEAKKRLLRWVDFVHETQPEWPSSRARMSFFCSRHFSSQDFMMMFHSLPGMDEVYSPRLVADDVGINAFPKYHIMNSSKAKETTTEQGDSNSETRVINPAEAEVINIKTEPLSPPRSPSGHAARGECQHGTQEIKQETENSADIKHEATSETYVAELLNSLTTGGKRKASKNLELQNLGRNTKQSKLNNNDVILGSKEDVISLGHIVEEVEKNLLEKQGKEQGSTLKGKGKKQTLKRGQQKTKMTSKQQKEQEKTKKKTKMTSKQQKEQEKTKKKTAKTAKQQKELKTGQIKTKKNTKMTAKKQKELENKQQNKKKAKMTAKQQKENEDKQEEERLKAFIAEENEKLEKLKQIFEEEKKQKEEEDRKQKDLEESRLRELLEQQKQREDAERLQQKEEEERIEAFRKKMILEEERKEREARKLKYIEEEQTKKLEESKEIKARIAELERLIDLEKQEQKEYEELANALERQIQQTRWLRKPLQDIEIPKDVFDSHVLRAVETHLKTSFIEGAVNNTNFKCKIMQSAPAHHARETSATGLSSEDVQPQTSNQQIQSYNYQYQRVLPVYGICGRVNIDEAFQLEVRESYLKSELGYEKEKTMKCKGKKDLNYDILLRESSITKTFLDNKDLALRKKVEAVLKQKHTYVIRTCFQVAAMNENVEKLSDESRQQQEGNAPGVELISTTEQMPKPTSELEQVSSFKTPQEMQVAVADGTKVTEESRQQQACNAPGVELIQNTTEEMPKPTSELEQLKQLVSSFETPQEMQVAVADGTKVTEESRQQEEGTASGNELGQIKTKNMMGPSGELEQAKQTSSSENTQEISVDVADGTEVVTEAGKTKMSLGLTFEANITVQELPNSKCCSFIDDLVFAKPKSLRTAGAQTDGYSAEDDLSCYRNGSIRTVNSQTETKDYQRRKSIVIGAARSDHDYTCHKMYGWTHHHGTKDAAIQAVYSCLGCTKGQTERRVLKNKVITFQSLNLKKNDEIKKLKQMVRESKATKERIEKCLFVLVKESKETEERLEKEKETLQEKFEEKCEEMERKLKVQKQYVNLCKRKEELKKKDKERKKLEKAKKEKARERRHQLRERKKLAKLRRKGLIKELS